MEKKNESLFVMLYLNKTIVLYNYFILIYFKGYLKVYLIYYEYILYLYKLYNCTIS